MQSVSGSDNAAENSGLPSVLASSTFTARTRRGDYSGLSAATAWLIEQCASMRVPRTIADELDFCASELLANIIGYAFDDADLHDVRIHLHRNEDSASLSLEDDGRAFDPVSGDTYVEPETLDAAGHRGYGVHLVRRFADDMQYQRENGRNLVTVVKFLPTEA
jgi:anti-sigma regulatory factor (Ser/Thr protein kinase)